MEKHNPVPQILIILWTSTLKSFRYVANNRDIAFLCVNERKVSLVAICAVI